MPIAPEPTLVPTLASLWIVSQWPDVATRLGVPVTSLPWHLPVLGEGMCGSVRGSDTLAFKCVPWESDARRESLRERKYPERMHPTSDCDTAQSSCIRVCPAYEPEEKKKEEKRKKRKLRLLALPDLTNTTVSVGLVFTYVHANWSAEIFEFLNLYSCSNGGLNGGILSHQSRLTHAACRTLTRRISGLLIE